MNFLEQNIHLLKNLGAVIVSVLAMCLWIQGYLSFIFYILGLYLALYIISRIFNTTSVITSIFALGSVGVYVWVAIFELGLLYVALSYMFGGHFFWGFILVVIGMPIVQFLVQIIVMSLGYFLAIPLFWMIDDFERREKEISSDVLIK